jgi:hypothetical protein
VASGRHDRSAAIQCAYSLVTRHRADITNPKPGWDLEYNLGWAVLDKRDPTNVLFRR